MKNGKANIDPAFKTCKFHVDWNKMERIQKWKSWLLDIKVEDKEVAIITQCLQRKDVMDVKYV